MNKFRFFGLTALNKELVKMKKLAEIKAKKYLKSYECKFIQDLCYVYPYSFMEIQEVFNSTDFIKYKSIRYKLIRYACEISRMMNVSLEQGMGVARKAYTMNLIKENKKRR